jgi:octaprenyl-diphosphate synthase
MTRALTSPDTPPAAPSLDRLVALVATDMAAVNQIIVDRMQSPVALIPQLASHLIAAGGKRLRPLITLAAAQLCGYHGTRHQKLAACVEFIHTATLLHDDVVDDSLLRRGAASANAIFGNKSSVLVGDFLFSRAFQLMVEDGSLRVLAVLSEASAVIAEGEVHQLLTTGDLGTTEAQYLEVISAKTAVLFAAAAEVGAVVADRPEEEIQALRRFGTNLGVAFQLIDDALDYAASEAALGKTVGDDFREGKVTLPVILAYARGTAEERAFWHRTIEELEQTEADLATAQALIEKYGTVRETVARARTVGEAAKAELARFPHLPIRDSLMEAIDFAVARGY